MNWPYWLEISKNIRKINQIEKLGNSPEKKMLDIVYVNVDMFIYTCEDASRHLRARYPITYIRTRILHTYYPTHMLRRYAPPITYTRT